MHKRAVYISNTIAFFSPGGKPDPKDQEGPGRRIRYKEKRFEPQQRQHGQCRSGIRDTGREIPRQVEEVCCGRALSADRASASGCDLHAQERLNGVFTPKKFFFKTRPIGPMCLIFILLSCYSVSYFPTAFRDASLLERQDAPLHSQ